MAVLDFPTSPTIGDTYTANGSTWTWDGVSWLASNPVVNKIIAGTGITISPTGGTGDVTIDAAGGGGGNQIEVGDGALIQISTQIVQRGSQYFQYAGTGTAYNSTYHDLTALPAITKQYGTSYSFGFSTVGLTSKPIWDGSKWLVVNSSATVTNQLATSTDGETWTVSATGISASLTPTGLMYANGKYFAFSASTNFAYSSDGVTWTYSATGGCVYNTSYRNQSLYWTGSQYVYASAPFANIYTSPTGVTWTSTGLNSYSVAYNGSLFVAVGASTLWRTSPDGTTWTSRTAPFTNNANAVTTDGTDFYVLNTVTNEIYKSSDGITWTKISVIPFIGGAGNFYGNFVYISGEFYIWLFNQVNGTPSSMYKSTDSCVTWNPAFYFGGFSNLNYLVNNGSYFLNLDTISSNYLSMAVNTNGTKKVISYSGTPEKIISIPLVNNAYMRTK